MVWEVEMTRQPVELELRAEMKMWQVEQKKAYRVMMGWIWSWVSGVKEGLAVHHQVVSMITAGGKWQERRSKDGSDKKK